MYLENYYLLPKSRYQSLSPEQYYNRISEDFQFIADTSSIRHAILSFGYFCKYFSAEELLQYLGFPKQNAFMIRSRLNDFVSSGYLSAAKLNSIDSTTSTVYYLTEKGHSLVAPLHFAETKIAYKRKGKANEVMHSYSTGLNFFGLFSSPYITMPFTWRTEVMLSGYTKGSSNALCADAYVRYGGYNIFIEEDLQNESNGILMHKFENYVRHGFMSGDHNIIILSCKQPYVYMSDPAYSRRGLKVIADLFKKYPERGLFYLPVEQLTEKDKKVYDALCGVLKRFHYGRANQFTLDDLDRYIDELDSKRNPYRIADYNKVQVKTASNKLYSLFKTYRALHRTPERDTAAYIQFLYGTPLYVLPTSLIGNYMYFMYKESGMEKLAYQSLCHYFPGMAAESKPVSANVPVRPSKAGMRLRNCHDCGHSGFVCVEFLSIDLGAMIRAYHFYESADVSRHDIPFHLVLVVDSVYDASRFCQDTGYREAFLKMVVRDMNISFILRRDLGQREKLFMLPTGGTDIIYYYDETI